MSNHNKKTEQLGLNFGTAQNRLKKQLMLQLVQQCGRDSCFRCGELITSAVDLSIDHKKDWLDVSPELFWDLNNIEFSHRGCNSSCRSRVVNRYGAKMERPDGFEYCFSCPGLKPVSEFWRNQQECKLCKNARNNEWRHRVGLRGKRTDNDVTSESDRARDNRGSG